MAKGKKTGGRQKGTPNKSTVKAIEDMAIMLDLNPDALLPFILAIAYFRGNARQELEMARYGSRDPNKKSEA